MQLVAADNASLPQRLGDFATLTEGLDYAARGRTGYNLFSGRGEPAMVLSYAELRDRALDLALKLSAAGLPRESRVALIAETTADFFIFFFACQYAGLIPMPLPLSLSVGGHEAYVRRLRGMLVSGSPVAAMASPDLIHLLKEAAQQAQVPLVGTPEEFHALPSTGGCLRPFGKDDPSYIQYSSGSTTEPRGVPVTQRAITANALAIARHLALGPADRATSWLPLYHDMGLVGFCITPMLAQVTVDYIATTTFALRPRTWLKLISEYGGTVSFSPTFGYELCVRRAAKDGVAFDLSRWRVAGIGGEMVRADVLNQFADLFAGHGFDARAFLPSYGLAEATLAVSFPELGRGMEVDTVDREAYEKTGIATPISASEAGVRRRSFVFCGHALPGYTIEICDDSGLGLPDRAIGRVLVRGPSLMQGYYGDPARSRAVLTDDGRLDTGDMGYLVDGRLVVTGRRKDMIIANGRNIWPQDLEWSVEHLPGMRSGSAAAFSVADNDEEERVVMVVECYQSEPEQQDDLRRRILATIQKSAGVHCEILLVAPRTLPYTSSGKLSRGEARRQYLAGTLKPRDVDNGGKILPVEPVNSVAVAAGARGR